MEFGYSKEQVLLREMYKKFAETEIKPLAEELDEEERFPVETVKKLARYGFLGIPFPKEYGGAGGDVLSYAMCVEELAKVCGTTAVIVSAHTSLCCAPIYENGTEEQKRKYLPDLLSGRKIGAFGLTEPNAGTDASGQQTTAVKNENGDYVLNGSKCFITNGNVADTFVVFAMTDKSKGNHGISAFIVEKSFPGFSTGKHEKKMGIRGSSTCDLIFEDCIVPKENLLGKEGKGFKIAMQTLDGGRIGIASQALGLGEGAVNEAVKYTQERVQFGRRLSQFHALNQKAVAKRYAKEHGKKYEDLNLIVCHMGGGCSIGAHVHGSVVDTQNALDGDGPFSPERSGSLPTGQLVSLCFSGKYTVGEVRKMLAGHGGLVAYTGSNDMRDLLKAAAEGDKEIAATVDAFHYQIGKEVGAMAAVMKGKVDQIILTGGIAYGQETVDAITDMVGWIAPITVYPGEDELLALCQGALRVMTGEEKPMEN